LYAFLGVEAYPYLRQGPNDIAFGSEERIFYTVALKPTEASSK